ncbi:HNH endonuclease [Clostridium sp. ZS1]|uniref:HNH endonuclease n=1 Tax=Clostridium sp. ZS1 TaxID=2949989 RepID=UPI00207A5BBD|nr:HNH endonuclease [Clostridium sp. ZS1]
MHRFIMNPPSNKLIDHINGNKLDNRKCNLRIVNKSQNAMNSKKPKNNTSGVKGVYWDKRSKKWEASIQVNMKKKSLGYFKNKD